MHDVVASAKKVIIFVDHNKDPSAVPVRYPTLLAENQVLFKNTFKKYATMKVE